MKETIQLNDGRSMPKLGMGTWYLGESRQTWEQEKSALRFGLDHGLSLIDTAEMYGDGNGERLVGECIRGYDRQSLFLVSKVYPFNAGFGSLENSLTQSIARMGCDYLDLYLLHWRGSLPLQETIDCMEDKVEKGLIKSWGVSNFDIGDMEELFSLRGGTHCAANQVLYHLGSRGVENTLLPWQQEHHLPLMAYCPLAQGGTLKREVFENPVLHEIAAAHGASDKQIMLAFLLSRPGVAAIPRTRSIPHMKENIEALSLVLTPEESRRLDEAFPRPLPGSPLDIV